MIRDDLESTLERLAAEDPAVAAACERLDWLAQKATMGWPKARRFRKSPPPEEETR
jgi:hypothetical protein